MSPGIHPYTHLTPGILDTAHAGQSLESVSPGIHPYTHLTSGILDTALAGQSLDSVSPGIHPCPHLTSGILNTACCLCSNQLALCENWPTHVLSGSDMKQNERQSQSERIVRQQLGQNQVDLDTSTDISFMGM